MPLYGRGTELPDTKRFYLGKNPQYSAHRPLTFAFWWGGFTQEKRESRGSRMTGAKAFVWA